MKKRHLLGFLIFLLLLQSIGSVPAQAQTPAPPQQVLNLLEQMTPEERVGQLFLVTFQGTDTSQDSQIYSLITEHHIGGVALLAENDNFVAAPDTLPAAYEMIANLQRAEWASSLGIYTDPQTGARRAKVYIPLFVAISQEGGGAPGDQILEGFEPLPSPMAIGATWNPSLAEQSGALMGQELASLGINLYFGPSLDVLESPNPGSGGDLGTRVFGGDPYWVGEMGKAFIAGIHEGGNDRILVIAKHFPGRGSSDRLPEEEVATVRKSLEQLKQIELAPFFAVTGNAPSAEAMTDGLLVSHIRYQGFQGNIRATTRPVSFDPNALSQILALPSFASWRESGGLVVSDNLGSKAVRDFYEQSSTEFSARIVARDSFLAGNDLLYLGNIRSDDSPDTYETILSILDFFAKKYREDPAFAQRVDESVTRILEAKYRLYPSRMLSATIPPQGGYKDIASASQTSFEIARNAATLLSPSPADLDAVLPHPPSQRDRILFLTDVQTFRQCSGCPEESQLGVRSLEDAVIHLYGPSAGGQTRRANLASYSFDDVRALLDSPGSEAAASLEADLRAANWIILSLVSPQNGSPELIRRFLSERQNTLQNKHILLFSFTAPYYLDATDISKLTAYYGLYTAAPPFVEVAARLIYRELPPLGTLPVSVSGIGYDLMIATTPDPAQLITLSLDVPPSETPSDGTSTPEPTPVPLFRVGDSIAVRTGVILDHNGNPVPDGTIVHFILTVGGGTVQQVDAETVGGVARASFRLEQDGLMSIDATSEPARVSESLRLDVSKETAAAVTIIAPYPTETETPSPAAPNPPKEPSKIRFVAEDGFPTAQAWMLVFALLLVGAWSIYLAGASLQTRRIGLRWALAGTTGGFLAYTLLLLGIPGSAAWIQGGGIAAIAGIALLGEAVGWGAAWLWGKF